MNLLIVGADRMEFAGLLAHLHDPRPAPLAVDWARAGELSGHAALLVANGAGAHRARAAMDAALAGFPAGAVISTGFCGALAGDLAIADIVAATAVSSAGRDFPALAAPCSRPHRQGVVVSIDRIASTAAEKRLLHATGAIAVEMEAGAVADRAASRRLPFYCLRAVSDLAGEDMANDFNAALREDGHFGTIRILLASLRDPLVRLPELLRLRSRCARAALVLGDFIADCRF